ncbi:MAG: CopG family transcriptional regulator [Armatimonadota bacterium]|nr:CopG family transcriptional regulator [Armatimonadota bacterium]MDR7422204.1 CopG family transcriptional regulator [Armatimonadota bacterium]MDR7454387.1 CopG family transcriptional regulator [Armatimonadota bacterium]MDR7457702.1 CopG family transcriptional regulator [Armatimonadota bacterium]MDR7495773.1 CopG family transcriptional regulator [Armatimonadota bacterium]
MIRTQILLTEEQAAKLRELARERRASVAELIRGAVDRFLAGESGVPPSARRRRALEAAGRFASGTVDVSARHDEHLERIYRGRDVR